MKLLTMYIDDEDGDQTLTVEWEEENDLIYRLGVLAWAASIETEAVKIRNMLDRYADAEGT